jgi:anti-sigma factor RsiW
MLDCKVVLEKLSCYVDGVVDEATMEMIETHLTGCRECSAELAALEAVRASMLAATEVEMPIGLSFSIREAISREAQTVSAECEQVVAMISEFVDGELDRAGVLMVQRHADSCESCAKELALTQNMVKAVGFVADVEPPIDLKSRIIGETVGSASPLQKLAERVVSVLRPVRVGLVAGSAAAAGVILLAFGTAQRPTSTTSVRTAQVKTNSVVRPTASVRVTEKRVASASVQPAGNSVIHSSHSRKLWAATVAEAAGSLDSKSAAYSVMPSSKPSAAKNPSPDTIDKVASAIETTSNATTAATEKTTEASEVTVAEAQDKKAEAAEAQKKPVEVKVAAGQSIVLSDDKAMIHSLKQQMKMQNRSEGVVNLFGSKF